MIVKLKKTSDKRFNQHKYALCNFFRRRGYDVDIREKTIRIDPTDLYKKENERLQRLLNYGFQTVNPNENDVYDHLVDYQEESFVDFADEILAMYS
jgi:hypothetical protein